VPTARPSELRRRRPAARRTAKTYDPAVLRDFLSPWLRGAEGSDGEQRMFCPLCEDPSTSASPSASINMLTGDWNCLKTEEDGGTAENLLRRLGTEKGMVLRASPTRKVAPTPRAGKSKLPPEIDHVDKATVDWPAMLRSTLYETRLAYLTTERGLSRKTLDKFEVGYDGQRYTVPIRSIDGVIQEVQARRAPRRGEVAQHQRPRLTVDGRLHERTCREHAPGDLLRG
jgi:hypothetical protein